MSRFFVQCSLCFTLLTGAGLLQALAQGERSLEERLLRPDRSQKSAFDGQLFRSSSSFDGRSFQPRPASELADRRLTTKEYEPKRFLGLPLPWTHPKQVTPSAHPLSDHSFPTWTSPYAETFRQWPQTYAEPNNVRQDFRQASGLDGRHAHLQGTNQPHLSQQSRPVSLEELRALLNKQVPLLSQPDGTNPR